MYLIKFVTFFQLLCFSAFAQEFDTVIVHNGSFGQYGEKYMVNGKEVEKDVFLKYNQEFKEARTCCPCLIQRYGLSEVLQMEEIRCNDTLISSFGLHENGSIKNISHFEISDTVFPHFSFGIGDVYAIDGEWVQLSPEGDTISSTTWRNGVFIEEFPKPKESSIWGLKIKYDGQNLLREVSTMKDFKGFKLKPFYKTKDRDAAVQIFITITDTKSNSWKGSATHKTLRKLDIKKVAEESNLTLDGNTRIWLRFMDQNLVMLGGKILTYNVE